MRNILTISIPLLIYGLLYNYIPNPKDLLLVSLLITTIIFWATNLIPDYQASLIFFFGALVFSLSPKEIIFSGFTSSAFWLVFAGMLIATAIKNTNLSQRFSYFFINFKNPSYLKILIYISIFSLVFSFLMPSGTGRVVLLVSIGLLVAKSFSFDEESKGYVGILLTFILSTSIPAFSILTANAPNIILSGLTSQIYNHEIFYSHYLLINFLVFGFIKNILIVSIIYYFYKDTPKLNFKIKNKQTLSRDEKIVLYTIGVMLIFWFTDFIHGINPSIIAIIGVLFFLNHSIGILKTKDINTINFSSLIFLAAVISLGNLSAQNPFTKELLSTLLTLLDFTHSEFWSYMQVSSLMALSAMFFTQATVPALFTPIAEHLSIISGFSLDEIFMIQVTGFSTVFLPYQMPPLLIGLSLAKIKPIKMIKVLLVLVFINIVLLYPLQYLWIQIFNS